MADQRSAQVKAGHFIAPSGPALLDVLEPHCMVVPDCGPPEMLTIIYQVPEMDPHVVPDGVRLHIHEGYVPYDKSHGRHGLILGGLPFSGVNVLMGPYYYVYSCSIG